MNQNKINSIKKLKKKGMYEITINDDVYKVTEDLIVKYYLIKDKILTDDELDLLKSKIEDENILLKVYNYISYQFRSEKEIEDYLYG
ncbi:MAG: recombination regulator RecX, partial [Bacilli bacterium]|nr:recombination regulator RecX [Bacilli bacterium]